MDYEVDLLHDIHDYMVIVVNMLMSFNSATNFVIYVICGRVSENTTGTDVFDKEYMTVSCTHVNKLQNKLSSF